MSLKDVPGTEDWLKFP